MLGYVFVGPNYIEGGGENIHIFEVKAVENETKTNKKYTFKRKAKCNHDKVQAEKDVGFNIEYRDNDGKVRKYVLELQDQGKKICGQCVATFYSNK